MPRKMWVVVVEDSRSFRADDLIGNKYNVAEDKCGVFMREKDAVEAAKHMAAKFAGYDVHVYSPSYGFICQPKQPEKKIWTDNGEYIPA